MNSLAAIKGYVDRLITGDGRCRGMKVLILDVATTQVVSCAVSQTDILAREVYLVTRLDRLVADSRASAESEVSWGDVELMSSHTVHTTAAASSTLSHLKAVCFLRPTEDNVSLLVQELQHKPRFAEYHIFFSGVVTTGLVRRLAEADTMELVKQVQEFYADFLAINEDLVTFNSRDAIAMTVTAGTAWARDHAPLYQRNKDGLSSLLLALKRKPAAIRYQQSSPLALQLARDIHESIASDEIFHFRGTGPLLLILDRMDDPVTPLLSQWTYQAMVHELLGLNNNRVVLRGAPGVKKDLEEVVLSAAQDEFFRKNRHANFGELGEAIKSLLDEFQRQTQSTKVENLNSIEEMQQFMEKFPQIRSQSHNVSKHVAIMGELARLVDVCSLMDISQFEQELACTEDHGSHVRELLEKLANPNVQTPDKLRLGLLYALRYEQTGNVNMVKQRMIQGGVPAGMVQLVDIMLRYAGAKVRGPGLYGINGDIMSKMTKSILTSVQGVSNVYAQHVPVLMDSIQLLLKGKLKESSHPYVTRSNAFAAGAKPHEIVVFMAGGTTFEEGTKIAEFNATNAAGIKVVLAGSTIHNSTSFLEELKKL
mmetsp:Transcript_27730/g.39681  ORF Transcript_27730/g.39681 Transcript_27730/m.39681 type:complete len:595 (+) Transcript_27730:167-1951(+)|eukprot:CAMPEP_0172419088 /NCGR_PEP_ID=MMETSP1064-20121228/5530_1 /TAXON_ID=202472 /ORGANISM="Aulacoseira subarctica , Strain CCAP 1002/5" /LENGTH=594 /DNA_ID=CAMNT_0013158367 /DNA_START=36 /DNA_END=1820 /DNA_ORIENTATION=+